MEEDGLIICPILRYSIRPPPVMRWLVFSLALVLLAGCDAGDPAPMRSVDLEVPLADLTLHVGESQEIDLAEHFRHSDGAVLTFEARRDSGSSVEVVSIEAGRVQLEALSEGRSLIAASAASGSGLSASAAFAVDVAPGLCPPEAGPGQVDYFPMEAGQVWLFDYQRRSGPMSFPGDGLSEGQVSMTFESVTCVNRVRTARVREVMTRDAGVVIRQNTRTFTEDSTNALRVELPGSQRHGSDPFDLDVFPRYAPSSGPDTLEYVSYREITGRLKVRREQGLVYWYWSAADPIWYENLRFDRVD